MRQWLVDPSILCRKHLMGEHVESHMMVGVLKKGHSIKRFLSDKLYDPTQLYLRHNDLVKEMIKRGYKHRSELEAISSYLPKGEVDILANYIELIKRCPVCASKIAEIDLSPYIRKETTNA